MIKNWVLLNQGTHLSKKIQIFQHCLGEPYKFKKKKKQTLLGLLNFTKAKKS